MNILGITVSHTLTFHQHIAVLVTKSARSFYALKTIRTNGLDDGTLWDVTRATLVSQLLYASPAWWGYLKADVLHEWLLQLPLILQRPAAVVGGLGFSLW